MSDTDSLTPPRLKWKELEEFCMIDGKWQEDRGHWSMGRYGVQVVIRKDPKTDVLVTTPLRSLPDFEGALPPDGQQFIFDAKVCSASSFSLHNEFFKKRQLSHMLGRARCGVICFVLVHFNWRKLKTREEPAVTYAFPVCEKHVFWQQFARGEVKSLSRVNCAEYGTEVEWWLPPRCTKPRPNLLKAIHTLMMKAEHNESQRGSGATIRSIDGYQAS